MTNAHVLDRDGSVVRAAWQYRWLVAGLMVAFALGAVVLSDALPSNHVARASIILEDPMQQAVLSDPRVASERNVQNQLEIFRSTAVAERAIQLSANEGTEISLSNLLNDLEIVNVGNTDMISVSYRGESEEDALNIINALLAAYSEVRTEQSSDETERILERLASAEATLRDDLSVIQSEIDEIDAQHRFDDQFDQLLSELAAIESQLAGNPSAEQRANLIDRQSEVDLRLRTLQLANEVDSDTAELAELDRRRDVLHARIDVLELERSDIEIQAQTAGSGIAFMDEARITSVSAGAGKMFTAAIGTALGLLLGLGWAYSLSQRRTTIDDRRQPEAVFDIPLLGDISRFGRSASASKLPVRDSPNSPVSEDFRFAASGIELALARRKGKGVVFLSNQAGQGKTLLIANTALAAARPGKKVLVIDADFGNQELTRMLLGDTNGIGLTEIAAEQVIFRDVVRSVELEGFGRVDVLSRGQLGDVAPEFFERDTVKTVFGDLTHRYDLVLVDVPPLMQVAYTSTIASLVENAAVVIRKGANMRSAEDLLRRARFIGVEVIGYIYNSGSSENTRGLMGSMRNVLGDKATGSNDVAEVSGRTVERE